MREGFAGTLELLPSGPGAAAIWLRSYARRRSMPMAVMLTLPSATEARKAG